MTINHFILSEECEETMYNTLRKFAPAMILGRKQTFPGKKRERIPRRLNLRRIRAILKEVMRAGAETARRGQKCVGKTTQIKHDKTYDRALIRRRKRKNDTKTAQK